MKHLTRYLARLFATDAMILFGIACFLLWLVNCLRSFELVSVKGQGLGTLAVQALYTMPPLALAFFYICVGIGMVRALVALQGSHELHIIHISGGLRTLWTAGASACVAASLVALFFSHYVEPQSNKRLNLLAASVAADLVSSTLKPGRFTQVTPGVVLLIGARAADGEILEFFADDRRDPETRRTYVAESARVSAVDEGYVLLLRNGTLQYTADDGRYSEVKFERYDVNVESLAAAAQSTDPLSETDSFQMITEGLQSGDWSPSVVQRLLDRSVEGLRVLAVCLMVLAVAGFPSGKRARIRLPLEAIVLLLAFAERGVGAYSPLGTGTGAVLMAVASLLVLMLRARPRRRKLEAPA